jgi:DNA-binding response OmpR family regulator
MMCLTAKILVIEDDPDYLERILTRLNKKGYQAITSVTTNVAAINELNNHYDVIVTDMNLAEDKKGGFTVVEEIQNRNITSIVIVLTANDNIKDCRKALRGGVCWDYISKSMEGSALEELHASIQMGLNSRDNRRDAEWIEANQAELLEEYAGKYIAVINHQVIVVADSNEEVKSELERLGLPLFVTVIRKIEVQLPSIEELITLGESGNLEFKSTLSWGVKENKKLDTLHYSVLKTIAAFLNSGDGRLLIGVANDGSVYGLEKDYSLCKTKDFDGFQLRLWDFIHDSIGKAFTNYIKIDLYIIEGKCVCAVDVIKAPELAFLKENNVKKFYIRSGNNSRDLDAEQLYKHLKMSGDV